MPLLEIGQQLPGKPVTVRSLIVEEQWGELWRGDHDEHGRVLALVYSGPRGEEAFFESLLYLRQWRALAPRTNSLLPILGIYDREAIPLLLVRDPGGPTLREFHRLHAPAFTAKYQLEWAHEIATILATLHDKGIFPVGLSNHLILHEAGSAPVDWRLAPCAPGHADVYSFIAEGSLLPKGFVPGGESWNAGLDTWALTRIWMWLRGEGDGVALSHEFSSIMDREVMQVLSRCNIRGRDGAYPSPEALLGTLKSIDY
ncbi:MAG: hypothetical protein JJU11_01615 [Candidatus Sumerlaeia bacterium]|nr:hypothetical protein [Candidatus Sumerlaeia bacterium]